MNRRRLVRPGSHLVLLLALFAGWSDARGQTEPPPPGDPTPTLCSDPTMCIEQLAGATVQSEIFTNADEDDTAIQITTFVWSARSFDRSSDFYMISQYVRSRIGDFDTKNWQTFVESTLQTPGQSDLPVLLPTDIVPLSSTCDSQVVNSSTKSFSGSIGLTTMGPEVGSSSSNSWSHQNWTSCSSLQIVQGSATRSIDWDYLLQDETYHDEAFLMTQQWIWEIPWTALASPDTGISFHVRGTVYVDDAEYVTGTYDMAVPAPFDAFSVPAPTLASATPSTVAPGTVFTLSGTNLYPTGISALFIAGNVVDPELWFPAQDGLSQTITVITPDIAAGKSLAVEVVTPGGVATGVSIEVTK